MAKLRMMIAILFLTLTLAVSIGVDAVGAIGPDHEGEGSFQRRTRSADFWRHNCAGDLQIANAGADTVVGVTLGRWALDADFLRHNVSAGFYAANAGSTARRGMQDSDFLRHNVAAPRVKSCHNKR
jgi:hypothetical protein